MIVIERILLLIRNLLHISSDLQEEKVGVAHTVGSHDLSHGGHMQRTEDDVSIHDQMIWNLHINGIDELLLFLGSNPDEVRRERLYCQYLRTQYSKHLN